MDIDNLKWISLCVSTFGEVSPQFGEVRSWEKESSGRAGQRADGQPVCQDW